MIAMSSLISTSIVINTWEIQRFPWIWPLYCWNIKHRPLDKFMKIMIELICVAITNIISLKYNSKTQNSTSSSGSFFFLSIPLVSFGDFIVNAHSKSVFVNNPQTVLFTLTFTKSKSTSFSSKTAVYLWKKLSTVF